MLLDTMIEAAMDEFKQNLSCFCEGRDLDTLSPQSVETLTSGLKQALALSGVAALSAYLLAREPKEDLLHAKGRLFRFKSVRHKAFLTPFGEMDLPRRCYQDAADQGHVPLDAAWGMEGHYMTPEVREAVLFSCAHVTPEETAQLLKKSALFTPHATAIKHVVEKTGNLIEANRQALDEAVRAREAPPEGTHALVASLDGATVLIDEPGARFGRPAERPRGEEPKETSTAYRVAMVGGISFYGRAASEDGPPRLASKYVAHMPEKGCPTFKGRFEAELDDAEAKLPPGTPRILLLDGARELWNYLDTNRRFDGYHRCIDFWHVLEHLSKAAEALFGEDKEAARKWYGKYSRHLRQSDDAARSICRSIDYHGKRNVLNKTRRKHLAEERTYFKRNGKRMPYATFLQSGWPVGSGPIEAACKTLVKTRLCRSGMRWSRRGGQRILNLRTYAKSARWDSMWSEVKTIAA